MTELSVHEKEGERLAALSRYDLAYAPLDEGLGRILRLTGRATGAPVAYVSILDAGRQRILSSIGAELPDLPRTDAICAHTIEEDGVFTVADLRNDERFAALPFVTREPFLRFYAGMPLRTHDGFALGSLCLADVRPRHLTGEDARTLEDAAAAAMELIEKRDLARHQRETADRLSRSAEAFRLLAENVLDVIIRFSADLTFLYASPSAERLIGRSPAEIVGTKVFDIVHADDTEAVAAALEQVRQGVPAKVRCRVRHEEGHYRWVEATAAAVLRGDASELTEVHVVARDVTEQVAAEEEILRVGERYHSLVEQASDAILVTEWRGRIVEVNRKACEMTGYAREELLAMRPEDLVEEQSLRACPLQWDRLETSRTLFSDRVFRRKDGRTVPAELSLARLGSGLVQVIGRDLTERRDAQEQLRASEQFLRSTLDALSAHVAVLDEHGTIVAVNDAWRRFAERNGLPASSVEAGQNYLTVCDGAAGKNADESSEAARGIRSVIAGASDYFSLEYPCHAPEEKRWFVLRVSRFKGEGAQRVVVAHENITARKLAEDAERQLRTRYQSLVEQAIIGVCIIQDERFVYANPQFARIFGYSEEEVLVLRSVTEVVDEGDRAMVRENVRRRISGEVEEVHYTFRGRHKNGHIIHVETHGRSFTYEGRPAIMGVLIDTTERVEAERAQRELSAEIERERAQLKDIFMHAPAFICSVRGPEHVFEMANPFYYGLVGHRDLIGKPVAEALPELAGQGFFELLDEVYRTGEPFVGREVDIRLRRTPGSEPEPRVVNFIYHPVRGRDERPTGIFVHGVDVTDQVTSREEARRAWRANQLLMDRSLDVICTIDRHGRFVQVSAASEHMWGYRPDEIVGRPYMDLVHEEDRHKTREIATLIHLSTPVRSFENRYVCRDGSIRAQLWSAVWSETDGLMFCVAHDLNELQQARHERTEAERALRESQARFAGLVEHSSEVITLLSPDGTVQYQSPSIQRVLGYTAGDLEGRNVLGFVHPDDLPQVHRHIEELVAGAYHVTCEIRFRSKDGRWRWLEISATNLLGDDAVRALVLNSRDVTDRKASEAELRQRELLLEVAAGVAHVLTTEPDVSAGIQQALSLVGEAAHVDRVYVFENHRAEEGQLRTSQRYEWCRRGIEPQIDNPSLQNQPIADLIGGWADDLANGVPVATLVRDVPEPVRSLLEAQAVRSLVLVPVTVDDEWLGIIGIDDCTSEREWSGSKRAMLSAIASTIGGALQRRRLEEERSAYVAAVARSEQRFRALVEATALVVWRADEQGYVTEQGEAWSAFTGQAREGICGWGWTEAVHPEDRERVAAEWQAHLASRSAYAYEYRVRRHDGVYAWFAVHAVPLLGPDGALLEWIGTCTNVDEQKRTLMALVESEERFRTLAESMPQLVWTATPDGTVDYYNGRVEALEGAEQRVDGMWTWHAMLHEDDRGRTGEAWENALRTGEPYTVEHRALLRDGSYQWFLSRGVPVRDANGRIAKWYGTATNIHDQKLAQDEMRRAKEEAEEMNRLKSSFLANMSHEIRTPLTAVIGYSDLLVDEVSETGRMFAGMIRSSGERLLSTLNSVLDLAQLESKTLRLSMEPVDFAEQSRQVVEIFEVQARKKNVALRLEVPRSPVAVSDPAVVGRILTNLVSNAVKFTKRGHVTVRSSVERHEVVLQVIDTGVGISARFLPNLFDEFRQESEGLARDYEGNGLGLAITKRLVDLLGGTIEVESEKGCGTTFTVRLPKDAPAGDAPAGPATTETFPRDVRVLAVEDDPETQQLLAFMLRTHFTVEVAANAATALERAAARHFDVVMLDINLRGKKTGADVLAEMRKLPGYLAVPIIACTAYAMQGDRHRFLKDGFDAYLSKPFRRDEVVRLVGHLAAAGKSAAE